MKEINVAGQKRTDLGKKASKELRKQGFIPCNLYGGSKTLMVSLKHTHSQLHSANFVKSSILPISTLSI